MAARLNTRHQEMVREKIRASQLVNRIENHVLGDENGDFPEMSVTQMQGALGLLRKCVPDLKASDDTLTVEGEIGMREIIKEYVSTAE